MIDQLQPYWASVPNVPFGAAGASSALSLSGSYPDERLPLRDATSQQIVVVVDGLDVPGASFDPPSALRKRRVFFRDAPDQHISNAVTGSAMFQLEAVPDSSGVGILSLDMPKKVLFTKKISIRPGDMQRLKPQAVTSEYFLEDEDA